MPRAEYVAAGAELALVRVSGAEAHSELIVVAGGRSFEFDPLPAAPGDDRVGFPVPLDLVLGAGSAFSVVVAGREVSLEAPEEAGPAVERERERRAAVERELAAARKAERAGAEEAERARAEAERARAEAERALAEADAERGAADLQRADAERAR